MSAERSPHSKSQRDLIRERLAMNPADPSGPAWQEAYMLDVKYLVEQYETLRESFVRWYVAEVFEDEAEAREQWHRIASNPASEPSIDGEEPCPDCGAPRKQGCGCWLDRPDHPWAKRRGSFQDSIPKEDV